MYRLVVVFILNEDPKTLITNKNEVINFMKQFEFIDVARESGLKFIYGLDMFKTNMHLILKRMMSWFQDGVIDKFNLYKYDL